MNIISVHCWVALLEILAESNLLIYRMFPIPDCSRSIGLHVLLTIAFGIPESPVYGNTIPANKVCLNVSDEIICYFKASENLMNWSEATHLCRSFDSTLPVIRNENDQSVIADYLKSHPKNSSAWTAGKRSTFDDWKWINDESLKNPDQVQYAEQDQQFGEQDHGAIDQNVKFTAYTAYEPLPYICQYTGARCDSSGRMMMSERCLDLINDSQTWYDARNQCLMTKGDLAVIGDTEREFLQQLKLNQSYWIGLRKKSFCWTLDDDVESNDEMIKYTNWDNNFATYGECISIDASKGTWRAHGCTELRTVVCQRAVSEERTIDGPQNSTQNGVLFAVVGIVIVIVICIIVIVVFVLRTKNGRSGQSKLTDGYAKNNREELVTRISNAPAYTSINEPAGVPVNGSDDIRGVYADIAMLTPEQSEDGGTNQQPGIVYASLDFNKDSTNLEPNQTLAQSTSSPTKVGPLGDIYAIPDAKGHAVTSPGVGSASHPVKVTPQGDVYAIPMKISTSPTVNPPIGAVYANLPTATLNKEQMAVESDETK